MNLSPITLAIALFAAQVPPIPPITLPPAEKAEGDDLSVFFEPPTANVDGSPLADLSHYLVAITDAQGDMNAADDPRLGDERIELAELGPDPADPTRKQLRSEVLNGLPGGSYRVWMAAVDRVGNHSVWVTVPHLLDYDPIPPAAPARMELKVSKRVASSFSYDAADVLVDVVVYRKEP
jgi:hypothetical protein